MRSVVRRRRHRRVGRHAAAGVAATPRPVCLRLVNGALAALNASQCGIKFRLVDAVKAHTGAPGSDTDTDPKCSDQPQRRLIRLRVSVGALRKHAAAATAEAAERAVLEQRTQQPLSGPVIVFSTAHGRTQGGADGGLPPALAPAAPAAPAVPAPVAVRVASEDGRAPGAAEAPPSSDPEIDTTVSPTVTPTLAPTRDTLMQTLWRRTEALAARTARRQHCPDERALRDAPQHLAGVVDHVEKLLRQQNYSAVSAMTGELRAAVRGVLEPLHRAESESAQCKQLVGEAVDSILALHERYPVAQRCVLHPHNATHPYYDLADPHTRQSVSQLLTLKYALGVPLSAIETHGRVLADAGQRRPRTSTGDGAEAW